MPDLSLFSFPPEAGLLVQGLCLGVLIAMGTYYLALFGAVQDRCFLYFAGYALGIGVHFLVTSGNGARIVAPTDWSPISVVFLATATLAAVCYPLFVRQFLLPARLHPLLRRSFYWLAAAQGLGPVVALVGGWTVWSLWAAAVMFPVAGLSLAAMILAWRRGYRPAGWLLVATAIVGVSNAAYVAPILGLQEVGSAEAILQVAIAIQTLVLGLAVVGRVREIHTRSRKAEMARVRAEATNEALRESLRLKSNLLGFAAHDLRTPLAGIIGFADLACEEAEDGPVREYAGHIITSATRLRRLVDDLLTTTELDREGVCVRTETADLGELVREVTRPFSPLAAAKDQQLDIHTPTGLVARLDRDRFQKVVDNLISNAIKYTPEGGTVGVEVGGLGGEVWVAVSDSGPGFTEADRATMFRPFQKLSARPTGGESSTGLGLAIVKKIVDLHEGRLQVDSVPGRGSRLTVALPAVARTAVAIEESVVGA